MQIINQCWKVPHARNKRLHKQASVLWHQHILRDLHGSVHGNDKMIHPQIQTSSMTISVLQTLIGSGNNWPLANITGLVLGALLVTIGTCPLVSALTKCHHQPQYVKMYRAHQ